MLDGLRVIDATWVLGGPYAGQLLAQLGADVVKVEPLEGDMSRRIPPHYVDGDSAFFLSANRGKRSVAMNLKAPAGRAAFLDLVRTADAVLYSFAPDVPARLGIDHEALREVNPRVCLGQLIGLHHEGDYASKPAFDLVVQALGGIMSITGEPGRPPVRMGYQIADLAGGLFLALGTVAAMLNAARSDEGQALQISLLDCQLSLLTWQAQGYFVSGDVPGPTGSRHGMIAPSEAFQGADGSYFVISPTGPAFWARFCEAVGRQDLASDPRFETAADRIANVDELADELATLFRQQPSHEWVSLLERWRIPAAPVQRVDEAVEQPLAGLRDMVEDLPRPSGEGHLRLLGNPFKLLADGLPMTRVLGYPPRLGEHTREVLEQECGYSPQQVDELIQNDVVLDATPTGGRRSPPRQATKRKARV